MEMFIKGKRAVEDAYLRQHVKKLVNQFYALHGLDAKDVEHKTMKELVELLGQFIQVQEKQVKMLQDDVKAKDNYIKETDREKTALAQENQQLEKRNINLYVRNEQLIRDVAERDLEIADLQKKDKKVINLEQSDILKNFYEKLNGTEKTENLTDKKAASQGLELT